MSNLEFTRRAPPPVGKAVCFLSLYVVSVAPGACGGSSPTKEQSTLPDPALEERPARSVPQASDLVKQGEQKLQAQDAAGAQQLFEQAIEQDAEDSRAHLDLGLALEMQGDAAGAEKAYRRAVELKPDLAEALNNLAVLVRARGDLGEAVDLLRRAAEANPGSSAARFNLALALEDQGDLAGAEGAYRQALELDPEALMARINLGLLLVERGDAEGSRRELSTALDGAKGNRPALLAIGNGLRRAGDAQGALRAMEAAVAAGDEATPALLSELALAQRAADKRAEAIATLEKVLQMDAKYATAHYLLGNMLAGDKRFPEAKKHYQRYLKLEPDGPHAARAKERLEVLAKQKK